MVAEITFNSLNEAEKAFEIYEGQTNKPDWTNFRLEVGKKDQEPNPNDQISKSLTTLSQLNSASNEALELIPRSLRSRLEMFQPIWISLGNAYGVAILAYQEIDERIIKNRRNKSWGNVAHAWKCELLDIANYCRIVFSNYLAQIDKLTETFIERLHKLIELKSTEKAVTQVLDNMEDEQFVDEFKMFISPFLFIFAYKAQNLYLQIESIRVLYISCLNFSYAIGNIDESFSFTGAFGRWEQIVYHGQVIN